MKYRLIKYTHRLDIVNNGVVCNLSFESYLFGIKIGSKETEVHLSQWVTWKEYFDFWDKCIVDKSYFNKKAFQRTWY